MPLVSAGLSLDVKPAHAQSASIYGVNDGNYAVFSSSGSGRAASGSSYGGSSWQPGSRAVYPAGNIVPSEASVDSNVGWGSGYRRSSGTSSVYGSAGRPAPAGGGGGSGDGYAASGGSAGYAANGGAKGLDPTYNRQVVPYTSVDPAGTVIVDTGARFLYLIQGDGRAIRYGIGVGRDGFAWSGTERVSRKAEWPGWTPPAEMIARRPNLPEHMEGGLDNPLGARALYLGNTLYRIHGTNEPQSIGQAVSSGCIRMRNDDVVDLYNRVRVGATVRVI